MRALWNRFYTWNRCLRSRNGAILQKFFKRENLNRWANMNTGNWKKDLVIKRVCVPYRVDKSGQMNEE